MAVSLTWDWADCSGVRSEGREGGRMLLCLLKLGAVELLRGWMQPLFSKMRWSKLSLNLAFWKFPLFTEVMTLPYFPLYWKHPWLSSSLDCVHVWLIQGGISPEPLLSFFQTPRLTSPSLLIISPFMLRFSMCLLLVFFMLSGDKNYLGIYFQLPVFTKQGKLSQVHENTVISNRLRIYTFYSFSQTQQK